MVVCYVNCIPHSLISASKFCTPLWFESVIFEQFKHQQIAEYSSCSSMKSKDQNPQTPKKNKFYRDYNHKSTIIMYMWGKKTHKIKLSSKLQILREKKKKKKKTNLINNPKIQKNHI